MIVFIAFTIVLIVNSVTVFVNNLLVRRVEWVVVLKPRLLQSNALLTFH
jgi:hypothetical protein